jgi:ferredoxin
MTVGHEVSPPALDAGLPAGEEFRDDPLVLESRGWTSASIDCAPKLAAIASLVNLAVPDPVASVSYNSRGNLLIVAGGETGRAKACAEALAGSLHVTLLGATDASHAYAGWAGRIEALTGFLGEFTATIAGLQGVDLAVTAAATPARFDLILDFSTPPLFAMRQPPQGYYAAPAHAASLERVLEELRESVGEFEKPRYFAYRENLCAHSRSEIVGCNACIEICSTRAISSDGDRVKVDPHLCMGCGACATVWSGRCPSSSASPIAGRNKGTLHVIGTRRRRRPYRLPQRPDGREPLAAAAACGPGLPARALPLETWHVAAVGLDLMLAAIAFGAGQVVVVAAGSEDREYVAALRSQMAIGETILAALGYEGTHFALVEAGDPRALHASFAALLPAAAPVMPGTFLLQNDKRTAIEFALEHLVRHAPRKVEEIALPAGAPYGEVIVDRAKCTMCMACVGSCPESALMDGVDRPMLKFLERNCVQCGLCESTCREDVIKLSPRLLLAPAVREARLLNETQPFHCVLCQKPFGTRQMVEAMLGRLAGHSMFTDERALRRLQMCADCRVVDMMSSRDEVSVLKLGADS